MFALCPDGGLPRLIRFVTLEGNILATLDAQQNLLRIDKEKYELISEEDQRRVIMTHAATITINRRS